MTGKLGLGTLKTLLIIVMLGVFFSSSPAWADTLYVDQTNTTGPWNGTEAFPYQKIQTAINAAFAGDTIQVAAGTYDVPEGDPTYPEGITIDKSLNLVGESPGNTFIDGANDGIYVSGATLDVNISGFSIKGVGGNGIMFDTVNSATVQNVIVCGAATHGIFSNYATTHILNSVLISNGQDGWYFHRSNSCTLANSILAYNGRYGAYNQYGSATAQNNCAFSNTTADFRDFTPTDSVLANPRLVDLSTCNVQLDLGLSPCRDAGRIGDLDPDGTRADIGAWGGPGAARFWPYPEGGPTITSIEVEPSSVPAGGTITIRATGEIR